MKAHHPCALALTGRIHLPLKVQDGLWQLGSLLSWPLLASLSCASSSASSQAGQPVSLEGWGLAAEESPPKPPAGALT